MPRFVATWPSFTSRHNGCANVTGGSMHRMLGLWFGDQQLETCPVGRIGGMARHDSAKAWAWRLFRAPDSDDERFLIAFLHAQSQDPSGQDWNCDEVARTEDEARAYALQFGVSPSSFTNALEHLRARLAAGNTA
jgi:hypothetical protein